MLKAISSSLKSTNDKTLKKKLAKKPVVVKKVKSATELSLKKNKDKLAKISASKKSTALKNFKSGIFSKKLSKAKMSSCNKMLASDKTLCINSDYDLTSSRRMDCSNNINSCGSLKKPIFRKSAVKKNDLKKNITKKSSSSKLAVKTSPLKTASKLKKANPYNNASRYLHEERAI